MPFPTKNDLPDSVKEALPAGGEEIYQKAFNNAWKEYQDPAKRKLGGSQEETAHRVAWGAVKKVYEKNDATGKWEKK